MSPIIGSFSSGGSFGRSGLLPPVTTLADAVGVTPFLHYQSSDLDNISNGTALTTSNPWINKGSGGTGYNMINDTSGQFNGYGSVNVDTANGFKHVLFNNFQGLAFQSASKFTLYQNGTNPNWTVAYVFSNGPNTSSETGWSSPAFCGHNQGPNTNIADRVEGGTFGWIYGQFYNWYDNDGGYGLGSTPGVGIDTANQWICSFNGGRARSWYGKTSSPFFDQNPFSGNGYNTGSVGMPISGIGAVRRVDSIGSYPTRGRLYDAVLWTSALDDTQIQKLRDYYAVKYPFGNITG